MAREGVTKPINSLIFFVRIKIKTLNIMKLKIKFSINLELSI